MLSEHERQIWLTMLRTFTWINQQLAKDMLKEDRVRINDYDVLVHLYNCANPEHGLRMQDLIDRVIISNSGMTRLIDRLVEDGLVARHIYQENRREVYVVITQDGVELIVRLMKNHQARIHKYFLQHVSEEELDTLLSIFKRVRDANTLVAL